VRARDSIEGSSLELVKIDIGAVPVNGRRNLLSCLVEIAGLEPAASGLQSRRSPS
jgi:hypothetical protein